MPHILLRWLTLGYHAFRCWMMDMGRAGQGGQRVAREEFSSRGVLGADQDERSGNSRSSQLGRRAPEACPEEALP